VISSLVYQFLKASGRLCNVNTLASTLQFNSYIVIKVQSCLPRCYLLCKWNI